jgi:hypothetical protein
VLDKSFGAPRITKDGVTVAKEIELEDKFENMGAQMVREVARPPPVVAESVPTQSLSAVQPLLALVGAIAGESEGIAIFLDGTTEGIIRLKTGESHAGWTLQEVKAREAILQKDHKTAVLAIPNPTAK